MKYFDHKDALTIEEASQALEQGAKAIAGGTDLLGVLKDKILPLYPEVVVNLKTITGMDKIEETEEGLKVGANVTLSEIAKSRRIKEKYPALGQAAYSVASPLIRNQATVGGKYLPGFPVLVLPLSKPDRRADCVREKRRRKMLRIYRRKQISQYFWRYEGASFCLQ